MSPTGDDRDVGDDAHPLRTIAHAVAMTTATTIDVRPGSYSGDVDIARDLSIEAREGATLDARVRITGAAVNITGLDVLRSLSAVGATRVALRDLRVSSSSAADTINLTTSVARFDALTLVCGTETCLQATGSTIAADGLTLSSGAIAPRRGVRAETSSVTLRGLRAGGATNIDIQATARAHLTLVDAELDDIVGNAVAVLGGSTLSAARVRIAGTGRVALLLSSSDATIRGLEMGPLAPSASGLGIEGGTVLIADSHFKNAGVTAIVVNDHRDRPADVRIERVTIEHGRAGGINLGQGTLTVVDARLIGDPSADGDDAVSASGDTANLVIESATIVGAAGHGVGVYNNAGARITANISGPRLGGVLIEQSAGAELRVSNTQISDCVQGSGVAVVDALDVELADVAVTRCPEAGVLGGAGADLNVSRVQLIDNRQYGIAAFGRSDVTVRESTVRGSKWAAFASCADGSSITDGGGNTLKGSTSFCP